MKDFLIIGITYPDTFDGEIDQITSLLKNNYVDYIHIRKPDYSFRQLRELIEKIPEELHFRLKIHDHFELLSFFKLGGVHLNQRNKIAPLNVGKVSLSAHSYEQLEDWKHYEYITLSPIFDSISKKGYQSAFSLSDLPKKIKGKNVVALGGVKRSQFVKLQQIGFYGAAMIGDLWIR